MVENGRIARGSYLVIESLDRLTREDVRAGLMLLLGLIESGIRIVQLSPTELVYDEKSDEMALMIAIVELSRGHRESQRKSDIVGPAWKRKKEEARQGKIVTEQLPAWIRLRDGKLELIATALEAVRLIFQLAANGYGTPRISSKLNRDGIPPISGGSKWVRGYIGRILRDRRALGEYQPRMGPQRVPDGPPVPNYFPPAITEAEFYAARAGAAERGILRSRLGSKMINVFAGLIRNARAGDSYYMTHRTPHGYGQKNFYRYYVLITEDSQQGRSPAYSFPYPIFEKAILELLAEVDPRSVVGTEHSNQAAILLSGELLIAAQRKFRQPMVTAHDFRDSSHC